MHTHASSGLVSDVAGDVYRFQNDCSRVFIQEPKIRQADEEIEHVWLWGLI